METAQIFNSNKDVLVRYPFLEFFGVVDSWTQLLTNIVYSSPHSQEVLKLVGLQNNEKD